MTTIYKYTSHVNGKVYVGKTSQELLQRHNQHRFGRHSPFNDALRKYGVDSFHLEILAEVDSAWSSFTEMLFIAALRSNDRRFGYNVTAGGEGTLGHRHLGDTKERIRQKMTGRLVTDDFRKKIGQLKQGNQYSLGLKRSQKYKDAVRSRMIGNQNAKGCVRSPETRLKMSLAAKRRRNAGTQRREHQRAGHVLYFG
jgi:group I intron endonuclease